MQRTSSLYCQGNSARRAKRRPQRFDCVKYFWPRAGIRNWPQGLTDHRGETGRLRRNGSPECASKGYPLWVRGVV